MILERLAGERYSRVLPLWRDLTVAILGGGPSLTAAQFEAVGAARAADRLRAIAVNDSYLLAPWADIHYAADAKWHAWHTAGVDKPALGLAAAEVKARWQAFPGLRCTIAWGDEYPHGVPHEIDRDARVHILRPLHGSVHGVGLSRDAGALVTGRNSGFQALNLAVLAGARRILLLGFDGAPAADGSTHWHGGHKSPSGPSIYKHFRAAMTAVEGDLAAIGVEVLNCSPGSAINSFPKVPLEEALA